MPSYRTRSSTCSTSDRGLHRETAAGGEPTVAAEVGRLSHALLPSPITLSPQQGQRCWTASTGSPVSPCSSRNSISWPSTAGAWWISCRRWIRCSATAQCPHHPPSPGAAGCGGAVRGAPHRPRPGISAAVVPRGPRPAGRGYCCSSCACRRRRRRSGAAKNISAP